LLLNQLLITIELLYCWLSLFFIKYRCILDPFWLLICFLWFIAVYEFFPYGMIFAIVFGLNVSYYKTSFRWWSITLDLLTPATFILLLFAVLIFANESISNASLILSLHYLRFYYPVIIISFIEVGLLAFTLSSWSLYLD